MRKSKANYPLFYFEEFFGTLQYLILLEKEGKLYNDQLISKMGLNTRTIENARGRLIFLGLIETEDGSYTDSLGVKRPVLFSKITESGHIVAKKLLEIEE
ncbi:unnamed protein product, partial [marine sediment metagenome]